MNPPSWPDCPKIIETVEDNVTWYDCRKSMDGFHERRLAAKLKDGYIVVRYSYTPIGAETGPSLERMTQSIRIHAF